jgi:hypothetical protein
MKFRRGKKKGEERILQPHKMQTLADESFCGNESQHAQGIRLQSRIELAPFWFQDVVLHLERFRISQPHNRMSLSRQSRGCPRRTEIKSANAVLWIFIPCGCSWVLEGGAVARAVCITSDLARFVASVE